MDESPSRYDGTLQAGTNVAPGRGLVGTTGTSWQSTTSLAADIVGGNARTVSVWCHPTAAGSGGTLVSQQPSSGQGFFASLWLVSFVWYLFSDGVNAANNRTLATGAYNVYLPHMATWVMLSSTRIDFYHNGRLLYQWTFSVAINTAASVLWVGGRSGQQSFAGDLLEAQVVSGAMSAVEVRQLFESTRHRYGV